MINSRMNWRVNYILMDFEGVQNNLFKVFQLKLKRLVECKGRWTKFYRE